MLLAIELGLRCEMRDLPSKFEKDRTKAAVAIVHERFADTHRHKDWYTPNDFTSANADYSVEQRSIIVRK